MEDKITIQKENILKAYKQASKEQKILLENIFALSNSPNLINKLLTCEEAKALMCTTSC